MPVIKNIQLVLSLDEFIFHLGKKSKLSSAIKKEGKEIFNKASNFNSPSVAYKLLNVKKIANNRDLHVETKTSSEKHVLTIGQNINLLKPAQKVFVFLYTIGDFGGMVDKTSNQGAQTFNYLESYLFDSLKVLLLEKTGALINQIVEQEALKRFWGIGGILSPGSLKGWDISDQKLLVKIVDSDAIGVKINESSVLKPFKSVTSIIGIGPEYIDKKVKSMCQYCSTAETCDHSGCGT